jgi:hypothetical protein
MDDETLIVPQSYYFCIKNALKLTYEHLYFQKIFRLSIARHNGKGTEKGGEGKGKGKGRDGTRERTRGYSPPPHFGTLSTPLNATKTVSYHSYI